MTDEPRRLTVLGALLAVIARLALFFIVVVLVWIAYVWLYAFQPDWLGWIISSLRPVTIWLYGLIDHQLPDTVKYKASAGLSDELSARSLLLLILGGLAELLVLAVWHALRGAFRLGRHAIRPHETV